LIVREPLRLLVMTVRTGIAPHWVSVTTTYALAGPQGSQGPVEVNISVTVPAEQSAPDGVYVAFNVVASGRKVPEPEEVQVPPVAQPPIEPPRPAVR
jgi:hypothetical protein